jgi:hypothetical protein
MRGALFSEPRFTKGVSAPRDQSGEWELPVIGGGKKFQLSTAWREHFEKLF